MNQLTTEILSFWFGTTDMKCMIERRDIWFRSTAEFDAYLARTYTGIYEDALAGSLDYLKKTPEECLSLIIMLDQFPRNMFRGTGRSFASDEKALETAKYALAQGLDQKFQRWPKTFMYLPFEHSEHLEDQEHGVELYRSLDDEHSLASSMAHCDAIRRFGRFPHRNAAMGRQNTPEEDEYLMDPPLWGKTAAEVAEIERQQKGTGS